MAAFLTAILAGEAVPSAQLLDRTAQRNRPAPRLRRAVNAELARELGELDQDLDERKTE